MPDTCPKQCRIQRKGHAELLQQFPFWRISTLQGHQNSSMFAPGRLFLHDPGAGRAWVPPLSCELEEAASFSVLGHPKYHHMGHFPAYIPWQGMAVATSPLYLVEVCLMKCCWRFIQWDQTSQLPHSLWAHSALHWALAQGYPSRQLTARHSNSPYCQ